MADIFFSEIFTALQGETPYAGEIHLFIRTAGCPLRCVYCDTPQALDFEKTRALSIDDLYLLIMSSGIKTLCVTGGEPLSQPGIPIFLRKCVEWGFQVFLFTSGGSSFKYLPEPVIRVLDIKTPGSGVQTNHAKNLIPYLREHDFIKFVVTDISDLEWVQDYLSNISLPPVQNILISPAWPNISREDIQSWLGFNQFRDLALLPSLLLNPLLHHETKAVRESHLLLASVNPSPASLVAGKAL